VSSGNGQPANEAQAKSISVLREAYRLDKARESTRMPRRREKAKQARYEAPEAASRNKHMSDSNTAPVREEREFAPAFGKAGRPRGATQEVVAVRVPEYARSKTVPESVQAGPLLDAYWASNHTPMQRAQERLRVIQKTTSEAIIVNSESVIGDDQRTRVNNTQDYPFRCICSLLITANTGSQYIGTGWLISPRLVLTAGHCVYMSDENGWASQIEVMPGRNVDVYPYGSVIATDMRSVTGWTVDGDRDYDYGAIILPPERRLGDELGWFGYAVRTDDYFPGIDLNLSGYPGDGGPDGIDGSQWQDHRVVLEVNERQITYVIDTFGGQSGAPVWETTSDGSRYGLAIHTWGTSTSNGATRITQDVYDNLVNWSAEVP
jgi:glutamyl endopeptidase